MSKLFSNNMSYNFNSFQSSDSVFRIIGTEYGIGYHAKNAIDEFIDVNTGVITKATREQLFNKFKSGLIWSYGEPNIYPEKTNKR